MTLHQTTTIDPYEINTKGQFLTYFRNDVLPEIKETEGKTLDYSLRIGAWDAEISELQENGSLPVDATSWTIPRDVAGR